MITKRPTKYKDIFGWFNFESVYDMIFELMNEEEEFVEVGVFEGKSLCYMGELSAYNNKKFTIHGVDTFLGSDEHIHKWHIEKLGMGLYETANINVNFLRDQVDIYLHKMTSEEASRKEFVRVIGAVFIDASHEYDDVKRDITLWLPKVKIGGILAGHDYGGEFEGVKKAVDECLSDYHIHTDKTNSCWWIYKLK